MSDENSKSPATSSPDKRRSTVPDIRPQNSFEKRYSNIINEQILDNSVNTEEIRRQLQVFLPSSRNASPTKDTADPKLDGDDDETTSVDGGGDEDDEEGA